MPLIFSNPVVWSSWNSSTNSSAATTWGNSASVSQTANIVWSAWNQSVTITLPASTSASVALDISTSSNAVVWSAWNQGTQDQLAGIVNHHLNLSQAQFVETPEQAQLRQQQREVYQQEQIRMEGERAKARERAEVLLNECLSEMQREELRLKGHFHLETFASSGERRKYRIKRGRSRNVQQVTDDGRVLKTLCMHPIEAVPDADTMLAQKFYLESCEDEFLRIANHS